MGKCNFYAVLDTSAFTKFEFEVLRRKGFVGIYKHARLGWVKRITSDEVEAIKLTHKININVWPDNDCYNFWKEYDVKRIVEERTIYTDL